MFKKAIRSIAFKLYELAKFEERRQLIEKRDMHLKKAVTIDASSWIYEDSEIDNYQNDNSKIVIGKGTWIKGDLLIFPWGGNIKIGDNCYVGPETRIWSAESISMGDNVLIAHHVNIIDFAHEKNHVDRAEGFRNMVKSGRHPDEKGKFTTRKVVIEDDVAIYAGAHIIMGVVIGKGSIISAGAVVLKDVPPFSLVMGNPAKVVWKIKAD